jgi:hypothetical protein
MLSLGLWSAVATSDNSDMTGSRSDESYKRRLSLFHKCTTVGR